jgi:hypothetical protein
MNICKNVEIYDDEYEIYDSYNFKTLNLKIEEKIFL